MKLKNYLRTTNPILGKIFVSKPKQLNITFNDEKITEINIIPRDKLIHGQSLMK